MSASDFNYSSDDEPVSKDHKKLLNAVSNLSKVQHIKKVARKEPSVTQNEFDLIKPHVRLPERLMPTGNSVSVLDLVKTLKGTSQHLNVGKELKNVQSTAKVLPKPLEKPEAERVARTITYEKTKKELKRWDAVVAQFQSAETQTFPLDSGTVHINTAKFHKPMQLSMKSELQIAFEEAEAKMRALKGEVKVDATKMDELKEQMLLTKDEIKKRRQELLYLKMRESQKSAKLRKQNKIKSKKYHRLLKQDKVKGQLKEFELLQKNDPEAALEKLKDLEKNRILERANLRHKNTGSWAKNNLVKAKYNRDIQKDLSEQLALSKQLTEKKEVSEDEDDGKSDDDAHMDLGNESNPWIQANSRKRDAQSVDSSSGGYRKYWTTRNENEEKLRKHREMLAEDSGVEVVGEKEPEINEPPKKKKSKKVPKPPVTPVVENGWIVEDIVEGEKNMQTIDMLFDKAEDDIVLKRKKKELTTKKNLAKQLERKQKRLALRGAKKVKDELKNLADLKFKNTSNRIDIDEELLETSNGAEPVLPKAKQTIPLPTKESLTTSDTIKHDNYADVKPKTLKASLGEITNGGEDLDFEDDDEDGVEIDRQATINDAFEDDDIVADFVKEKNEDEKKALAEQITLSMPGWGSWGGTGIAQNPAKKLVLEFGKGLETNKAASDDSKNRVRINEVANKKLREHLVSDIPFPFTSVKDYEASIRSPIGRNFVPETAFRQLTKPTVITRKGHIIKPMDERELLKPEKRLRSVVEKRIFYDSKVAAK